jgi:hypothetical protein
MGIRSVSLDHTGCCPISLTSLSKAFIPHSYETFKHEIVPENFVTTAAYS